MKVFEPEHSKWSASGSSIWLNCYASLRMSADVEQKTNPAAELGTAGHLLGEYCLKLGVDAYDCIGMTFNEHEVDDEMANAVQVYVSFIRDLCTYYRVKPMLEKRVRFLSVADNVYGTSDCIVIVGQWLFVIDYKHGYGLVEVKDNTQAIFYACAVLDTFELWQTVRYVRTTIVQPRADHVDGTIRHHTYTTAELQAWIPRYREAYHASKRTDTTPTCGSHCKYCPAQANCRPRMIQVIEGCTNVKPLHELTIEELEFIHKNAEHLKRYFDAVSERMTTLAKNGKNFTDFKLVKSITRAKCEDELGFINAAVKSGVDWQKIVKPVSMTEAKKHVSTDVVNQFFMKPEPSMTLVKITDSRPAIGMKKSAVGVFPSNRPSAVGIFNK